MAIEDVKGTVSKGRPTLTGMMNKSPTKIDAPNLSGMKKLFEKKTPPKQIVAKQPVVKQEQPPVEQAQQPSNLVERVQNLTDEERTTLASVLSPSVKNVLSKVAPELNPLLSQFTKEEENVILPVSVVKNFAVRKYGGQTEAESVQSFVADLAGQMEQTTNVPPETEAIDQDLV